MHEKHVEIPTNAQFTKSQLKLELVEAMYSTCISLYGRKLNYLF